MPLAKKFGCPLACSQERDQAATSDDFINYVIGNPTGNLYLTPIDPRLNPSISYSKTNAVSGSSEICAIGM